MTEGSSRERAAQGAAGAGADAEPGGAAGSGAGRRLLATGIPGLDAILGGGLPRGCIALLTGGPGTGKTVMANQLCFARARRGERCVYVTLLAETHGRMLRNLESFAFFEQSFIESQISYLSGIRTLRSGGLRELLGIVEEELERLEPRVLILDGIRLGVRVASATYTDQSAFLNRLAVMLELADCTGVICSLGRTEAVLPEHALADAMLELEQLQVGTRAVRKLCVAKLRGGRILEGKHLFEITGEGAVVHPRSELLLSRSVRPAPHVPRRVRFGISRLDRMLHGGVPAGSVTALIGATGSGKTLMGLHFLAEGAGAGSGGEDPTRREEAEGTALYVGFYESPDRVLAQGEGIGLPLRDLHRRGLLLVDWHHPYENLIDPVVMDILERVREREVRRLYIDGLEGFARSAVFRERVPAVIAALLNELRARGVSSLVSVESELLGINLLPEDAWSPLAENTILLRYVELRSHLRRLLWIVKVRGSDFDSSLREFRISEHGIEVAETFESAEAILTGIARTEATAEPWRPAGDEDHPGRR